MKGILAVNHFLNRKKYCVLHNHLLKSARKAGIDLALKTNLELSTENSEADFVLFWDKDINLANRMEKEGLPVFNSSKSIELCDDKAKTYIELLGKVRQPETIIAPKIYFKSDLEPFAEKAGEILGYPLVFKECFGSFGEQVFLCRSKPDILSHISTRPFLLQKFIGESAGHDIRIEVVGGKVAAAMERQNKNDFRANITNGGTAKPYTPTSDEEKTALTACRELGLNFGGIDILDGNIFCEANSNAHIINIMECTGVDIAPLIFEEIRKNI
ncbi:MAG: RimK family alpha-L-glutamate ligase [Clostridiales bacterium]|nr:RimK family alpha-L-glutamate ligase [Clostridiales bacterium]